MGSDSPRPLRLCERPVCFASRGVVVFDMDDTVFPEEAYVFSGFAAVSRVVESKSGVAGFAATARALHESGVRGDVFNRAAATLGLPGDTASIRELITVYRAHAPTIALDAWVLPLFAALRAQGRRIALLTDGPPVMQRAKIKALGLDALCDALVVSDELGGPAFRKPHAAPYRRVMDLLGDPDSTHYLYIGDNPTKDFIGARDVAWASLRLRITGRLHAALDPAPGFAPDAEVASGEALATLMGS